MKKNFLKKPITAVTAALMVASTAIPVSAANYTITIDNICEDHTYQAYQIFAGTLGNDGTLGEITWGDGVSAAGQSALGDAATKAESLTEDNVKDFAAEVAPYLATVAAEDDFDNDAYALEVTEAGYYLVIDKPDSLNGTDESYTSYILKVVENVEVEPKSDVPTVEKKVQDKNDTDNTTSDWQDSADYDIGDEITFQITVTLPNNFEDYNEYDLYVTDVLSDGLTYNYDASITIDGNTFTSYWPNTNTPGTVVFSMDNDVLIGNASNGSVIKITYTATLNENAVVSNENEVYITYSNNPNTEMGGSSDDTGTSPTDKAVVFTYDVVIDKVDESGDALTGAEFTLEKDVNGTWTAIDRLTVTDGSTFTFSGLDDGDYRLTETKTPDGYNSIEPIEFTISATHDAESEDPQLTALEATALNATADLTTGTLSAEVENQSGSSLPGTGGIGRTIFFVTGGVLIVAAGIILIIKKRMNNAE